MKNDQVLAARKTLNPHRATIKLETVTNQNGSETFTPYLIASPASRGGSFTVTTETAASEVSRLLINAISPLL